MRVALKYSTHAREQMERRGISELDVENALSHPQGSPDAGEPGSIWIHGFAVGGRILKVCVRANDTEYVITAVWRG